MNGLRDEDIESVQCIREIDAMYEQEAYNVIYKFIEIYGLKDYEISEFTLGCITSFLMEWNFYNADLPKGAWVKVIKMYMEIIEIDFAFLEKIHADMCRTH